MSDGRIEQRTFKAEGTAHPGPTARWAGHGVRKEARGAAAEQPRVSAVRQIMWDLFPLSAMRNHRRALRKMVCFSSSFLSICVNSFVLLTLVMQVGIFLGGEREKSNFTWSEIGCFFAQVYRLERRHFRFPGSSDKQG